MSLIQNDAWLETTMEAQGESKELGTTRLLKLVRANANATTFIQDIQKFPKWYLTSEFLKRQPKTYFTEFFNYFKTKRG